MYRRKGRGLIKMLSTRIITLDWRRTYRRFALWCTALLLLGGASPLSTSYIALNTRVMRLSERQLPSNPKPSLAALPLSFEPNAGQAAPGVRFLTHVPGGTLLFRAEEVSLLLKTVEGPGQNSQPLKAPGLQAPALGLVAPNPDRVEPTVQPKTDVLRVRFLGSSPATNIAGGEQLQGKLNYLLGNDRSKWLTGLPTYSDITYTGLYPGIDLTYGGEKGQLKSTYTLAPGADPALIRWRYDGADKVNVDKEGNLQIGLPSTLSVTEQAPLAWQQVAGRRIAVSIRYNLHPDNSVSFKLGSYDKKLPLTIDPYLTYSTYLGGGYGGGYDYATSIAVDAAHNIYITGVTESTDFPIANALQPIGGNRPDAFVTKMNSAGTVLIYSTYLGGSGNDYGYGIAVDADGDAYVTGETGSNDFPVVNAIQPTNGYGEKVFISKLNPTGSALIYSTYLGGSALGAYNSGRAIAVGPDNSVYVTGETYASDFPTVNPIQATIHGGADAFVSRINPAGTALIYSTYLGGSSGNQYEYANGIAVDSAGSAYITGFTPALDFPTLNAIQPTYGGGQYDGFLTKINPTGSALVYSTYLGGSALDSAVGVAVDPVGDAYVTGVTQSANFPTYNPLQPSFGGVQDAFVTELNPAGTALVYSTYLGGRYTEFGGAPSQLHGGIAVDALGNAYVTGTTASDNFPTADPIQATNAGCFDVFVSELTPGGVRLLFSTYLGGGVEHNCNGANDFGSAIAVRDGDIYVAGSTTSPDFPSVNPFQGGKSSFSDAFVLKIAETCEAPQFSDVPEGSTFYPYIRCMACRSIVNGYGNGTFGPDALITRAQLAKVVAGAAAIYGTGYQGYGTFEDVPYESVFFQYIERLADRGVMSGYPCGTPPAGPCVPYANKPYFLPANNATRGQISKIVSNAALFQDPPGEQLFEDVEPGSTFYTYTQRLASRLIMSGYPCGAPDLPCVPPGNRPYFRPGNDATRGQVSKIAANTFFPGCQTQTQTQTQAPTPAPAPTPPRK